ncbi:MAG TPA: ATP-dependent DNA helicase RecG [Candidatus Polarisedimenticolaceae bacterium]|nr:ATP-dependent DNA helicase RecG [Candidatus Polarisedimenticolaceae bacterium]
MSEPAALRFVKGIGPKRAAALEAVGIASAAGLLEVLPFRWEDRRAFARVADLVPGGPDTTLDLRVASARLIRTRQRGFSIFQATLEDASGAIKAVWYNQPYLERVFTKGARVVVFGHAEIDRRGEIVLANPDYERLDADDAAGVHTGRIVPVYRKLGGLTSKALRAAMHGVVEGLGPADVLDPVPAEVRLRHGLLSHADALAGTHFPPGEVSMTDLAERRTPPQRTLAFTEIFLVQLALAARRDAAVKAPRAAHYEIPEALREKLAKVLPFKLTGAQKRVLREIGDDLRSPHPMSRLLQGDVGSGKTIVALMALLVAIDNGHQGALMAPTEILADQHARNILALLQRSGLPVKVAVLTGSQKAAARRRALADIANGHAQLVIGTHALFEAGVTFKRLGLVVVDEQHRFGVMQRAALVSKGSRPDVLVMTATPIPRSLALTLYGDLDLSVLDELPPGRTPITTVVRTEKDRARVYTGLRQEIARGRQAYVVVPLVEETARTDLKAATAFASFLKKEVMPDLVVGLLHGRMKGDEKDRVMSAFARGAIQVLVATTVVEVGVDVPNASVMIVEHAERFGLFQLHQLRGRVGRGSAKSYCVLMVGEDGRGAASERLRTMEATSDGFKIAEKDLELRGPGAVFGTQQHGLSDLQFLAVILRDPALLDAARAEAQRLASEGRAEGLLAELTGGWRQRLELPALG